MYAILDIETTGGQYNEEGITEIAIYKFDGHQVIDQFISLVNPEKPIQPFVVKLTGINNNMLELAPKFYEVAKRIIQITQDCVLVAHNATFDYRILRTEFRRLGYDYQKPTLCTVELSKKLIPNQPSYSLGKLVRGLGIPVTDRHRASGDALATVKLFKILLGKDLEKQIVKSYIKTEIATNITPKFVDLIAPIPSKTGIYYIHKQDGSILCIGKSKNLKKRVTQHFTSVSRNAKKIQAEVATITFEETGSELIAILKEAQEININKPIYNKIHKRNLFAFALYMQKDNQGYFSLVIQKTDGRKKEITTFGTLIEAQNFVLKITQEYQLCQKINGIFNGSNQCFALSSQKCNGACINQELPEIYNDRVQRFIKAYQLNQQNKIIIDNGRNINERSAILIESGILVGYCFYDLNYQITNISILKNIIIALQDTKNSRHIIENYIRKKKNLKILSF